MQCSLPSVSQVACCQGKWGLSRCFAQLDLLSWWRHEAITQWGFLLCTCMLLKQSFLLMLGPWVIAISYPYSGFTDWLWFPPSSNHDSPHLCPASTIHIFCHYWNVSWLMTVNFVTPKWLSTIKYSSEFPNLPPMSHNHLYWFVMRTKKSIADNKLELFCNVIWWLLFFCMARTDNYLNSNRTLKMMAGYLRNTVHMTLNVINGIHADRFWVSSFTIRVQQDVSGAHWSRWNMCGRHVLPIAL